MWSPLAFQTWEVMYRGGFVKPKTPKRAQNNWIAAVKYWIKKTETEYEKLNQTVPVQFGFGFGFGY